MKLFGKCPQCKSEVSFYSDSSTRVEFSMREGKTKKISCDECGSVSELSINNIYTKKSNLALLIAGLIFLVGTPLIIYSFKDILFSLKGPYSVLAISGLFVLPSIVYFIIQKEDQNRVSTFNRVKINNS